MINFIVDIWQKNQAPLLSLAVFVVGLNVTTIIWGLKFGGLSKLSLLSTWCTLDRTFYKKLFVEGPGVLFIICWLVLLVICGVIEIRVKYLIFGV